MLERGLDRLSPFPIPMMLCDTAAGLVAIETGALGPNYGLVSACASSGHGIGEAAAVIARGDATVMLAGGAEACITPFGTGVFCRIKALSERNHEPERACRPWDMDRDGFVIGEGAAGVGLGGLGFAPAPGAAPPAAGAGGRAGA